MKNIFNYQTSIGRIGIAEEDNQITNVFFETDICNNQNYISKESTGSKEHVSSKKFADLKEDIVSNNNIASFKYVEAKDYYFKETETMREASRQLYEYLEGKRKIFNLPLAPHGTTFMKSVWNCLCDIPYGKTKSYKEIAKEVGNAKACRAVGLANNRNPIPIFIPCHRVIGANGKLIGYRGGLKTKLQLLELEKQYENI